MVKKQQTVDPHKELKILNSISTSARANQLVRKRYRFPSIPITERKNLFFLESTSPIFDRILRRTPREVYRSADVYSVPLGYTCIQTIVSTYGLSYGLIYAEERWDSLMTTFNYNKVENTANQVIHYLRAAAYLKYLTLAGKNGRFGENGLDFAGEILSISDNIIVSYFSDMIK